MSTLVISPSSIISTYCYSILRLETYHVCTYSCLYCYARWYRFQDPELTRRHVEEFLHYVRYVSKTRPRRLMPFRVSTLVDPLQREEQCLSNCKLFLETCLQAEIPLLLNTKSDLVLREDILSLIVKLADHGLIVVQISVPFLSERAWRILEPNAPSPWRRIEIIEALARQHEVPVTVRIQPATPGFTDLELRELVQAVSNAGARHVVTESLRLDVKTLHAVSSKLPEVLSVKWVPYTSTTPSLLWPEKHWRRRVAEIAQELCDTLGLSFATCKEEFLDLWTAPDCCGIYLLTERAGLRITIRELATHRQHLDENVESILLLAERLNERYLTKPDIDALPRPVRRKIVHHYKVLLSIVKSGRHREILKYLQDNTRTHLNHRQNTDNR